jgi:hypothetical protein
MRHAPELAIVGYCGPWVRSLIHSPDAVAHSPAGTTAACPITVTSSRWPHALIRKTQKPFSSLWYVTRPDTTRLASILVVNETHDAMPFAKSTQIECSGATVASPTGCRSSSHEQGSQPPV